MPIVTVQNEALQIEVANDTLIIDALKSKGLSPYGMFSKWMPGLFAGWDDVLVLEGKRNLTPPTDREKKLLGDKINWNMRLASEAKVTGDIEIHTVPHIKI